MVLRIQEAIITVVSLMAVETITRFTPQLVTVISDCVLSVLDRCLGKRLISNEMYETILQSTNSTSSKARTLLKTLQYTVAADGSLFDVFIGILNEVAFPGSMLLSQNNSDVTTTLIAEMERVRLELDKCSTSDRAAMVAMPSHLKSMSVIQSSPQCLGKLETVTVASKVRAIEEFTPRLVFAISSTIEELSDRCLASGLISEGAYGRLLEQTSRDDRARKLLMVIRRNIRNDDRCFNMFLNALKEVLPPIMDKFISEIKAESEKVPLVPAVMNGKLSDLPPEVESDEDKKFCIVLDKYVKANEKLVKVEVEKKVLQKDLESKIMEDNELKEELRRMKAEGNECENAERIKYLNEVIAEREGEISKLKKTIREKDEKIEECRMNMKRERAVVQEESKVVIELRREARELEMEMRENLKYQKDKLQQENDQLKKRVQQEMNEIQDALEQERDDFQRSNGILQKEKDELIKENRSVQNELKVLHEKFARQSEVLQQKSYELGELMKLISGLR